MAMEEGRGVLYAKKETEYGTDAAPTTTDAIFVENAIVEPVDEPTIQNVLRSSFPKEKQLTGKKLYNLSFEFLGRPAAVGVEPPEAPVLFASGMSSTVSAGSSVIYDQQ